MLRLYRLCAAFWVLLLAAPAGAQDAVRLADLVPALEDTELGRLAITSAPPPGGRVVVRRGDVLAALRRAGRTADGLSIPRRTVVEREAQELDAEALSRLARESAAEVLAPCRLTSLDVHGVATVAPGSPSIRVEGQAPRRSGPTPVVVVVGARAVRVPAHARVECPAPVVSAGRHVRLQARFGNVVASMPGIARQPGRVGDVIRVTSGPRRRVLRARVRDANTLEVVP